jgi:pimeloyl-ACP methyl ester carboxylesterase
MQKVYFISGLGADERAFSFLDLTFCHPVFVRWVRPAADESIQSYAARLKQQIPDENPVIVGLSFGGMLAVELAKAFPYRKLILLSSAKTRNEIPFYLRFMRYVPIHKLATPGFLKAANQLAYKLMGIHKRKDKVLFTEMLAQADDVFLKWAINTIINWQNQEVPANLVHIHGTKDILLPYLFVTPDVTVKGGVHLMVMNRPEQVSKLLKAAILETAR